MSGASVVRMEGQEYGGLRNFVSAEPTKSHEPGHDNFCLYVDGLVTWSAH
jgi:hypothetical protein